ncbi:carbon-nitrogen hydrolase family protein [Sphingomonas sp. LB-2]|uniref:carbon-nitrogen hydrolase family protein n=1 Tax=Sphingomonas caeni TaxID=2984949 RepID=UPI00222E57B3|nr:carbon-nitrogen hydrolase family protein [Sphingomonas caeni]MCW3847513.1 carbon-nitrogen hydrolase family protein [Sphingomonas caeni]
MIRRYKVAAAQYPVEQLADFAAWQAKLARWVGEAADAGAKLAVFPEYAGMELTALDAATVGDLHASIAALGAWVARIDAAHAELAAKTGMHILAGSLPVRGEDGRFRNHARLFTPGGRMGLQQKIVMTRFEREAWDIAGGSPIRVFRTELGMIGVAICYDSEFPLLVRAQAEAGAELILVPSATDTLHGWHRVRTGARARALENQCYVVQSPVVGAAEWTPALDVSRGAAGVFGPADIGFPEDGVVAEGVVDAAGWVFGEVDLDAVAAVRGGGAVFGFAHWGEQLGSGAVPGVSDGVEVVDLR